MSENTIGLLPVKRKPGRPRKSETTPVPEVKKKPLLPVLKLDLTKEPSEQILNISDRDQAKHLGWRVDEVRSVNSHLNLYDSLPMVCQASGCYYASQCPTRPDFKFEGYLCPLQTMDVYRFFLGYVRDLDIQPTDYVDLRLVEDLVRIDLQLKTVDQKIQIAGLEADTVGGIIQSTGKDQGGRAVYEKIANPLLLHQDKLRNRRREIHKSLIANRFERLERDRKEGKTKENITNMFEQIMNLGRPKSTVSEVNMIDGEYTTDEEDNE
ncbi:MAG TPA: hypothetical protein VEP90_03605 [Methylomirabilota bacterium]|nr:hypothetical protein [Methylomirabilota bacterium]